MIKKISLKFGSAPGEQAVSFDCTPVTVFVGPNNSGKSKALSEILHFCSEGTKVENNIILSDLIFDEPSEQAAKQNLEHVKLMPRRGESLQLGNTIVGKKSVRYHMPEHDLLAWLLAPNTNSHAFCFYYLSYNTIILNGQNRINLIEDQPAGDLQQPAHSSFQVLFRDDNKRSEVRRIVHEAFGLYLTIDPTNLGQLRLRLSKRAPSTAMEERGIHDEAVSYHSASLPIHSGSDGIKAFTGMITEIIAGDPKILLIDEPEAFLHPSLAYKLGKEIAQATLGSDKRIFVSTHSPNFVMGCIQSGTPVNIVRLTYRNEVSTARILPNHEILRLMRNPLLRSTGVLEGLFYEYVIVTESDTDRAFYQEINERLLNFKPEWGIPNCLFINAQNKQTVKTILKPLRSLGIPAAGVVDIDILKEGGTVWTSFLESGFLPSLSYRPYSDIRAAVKQSLDLSGSCMKRHGGLTLLNESAREAGNNLFDELARYGLFVVRHGELESWLQELQVSHHGPTWLIEVFNKIGEDPDKPNYLKPGDDDVWRFIFQIKEWFFRKDRKGIPF
ncbi:putative ATP-dependent endonuclease of OLD family [Prosthecobacter fusiformis]|uniref:Putative ATP-dependent endonuclease of OLD family n=1 Tax=Prosthecobacter fusiformis TaxID=48464 RepID=A0A4V3FE89_9BACT|nr:ATP-binding protein [Prosthecobacter fusiformis]TDU66073.1 putative ATP-dependent endonuclease of OLD family [Prosthecobacter fusiformis]